MKIALGVTGGVAAYKAAELVRRLQQEKLDVQVVMTRAAQEFIAPLTFAAITGQKVITDMFRDAGAGPANVESAIEHIAVAQRIDLLLVAPATADVLGKFAHGIAEDFLGTLYLATKAPVVVAPAMNVNMWDHAATRENVAALRARGVHVVDPDEGYLACGMTGAGRLAATETIAKKVCEVLGLRRDLDGQTVLVTAGPTCEDIDPVRYLTNRSSGKMGYALAEAAQRRGAHVILVSGPTERKIPEGVDWIPARSTEEMRRAVLERAGDANIAILAAAVADFRRLRGGNGSYGRKRAAEIGAQGRRRDRRERRDAGRRGLRHGYEYRHALCSRRPRNSSSENEQARGGQPHPRSRAGNSETIQVDSVRGISWILQGAHVWKHGCVMAMSWV